MSGEQGSEAGVGGIVQPIPEDASVPEAVAAGGSGAASGEPTAVSSIEQASSGAVGAPVAPAAKPRKATVCGNCGETGHNRRSCPQQPSADSSGVGRAGASEAASPSPSKAAAKVPAKAAAKTPTDKKKKAASTAKGLKQGAAVFKAARDAANAQEHTEYKDFHLKTWRALTTASSSDEQDKVLMPVGTMGERRAVQIAIEDKWWDVRIWPDMQKWGKGLDETVLLAPDQAEAVAAFLDGEGDETDESEGGGADEAPDPDAIGLSAEA
jgi:hypothetical protein